MEIFFAGNAGWWWSQAAGTFNRTDDSGGYRITGLEPYEYFVMATTREAWNEEANPKERIGFLPTYSGGTHLPASAARVKVGLGQEAIVPDFAWCPGASAPSPASRQTRPVRLRTDDRRRVASAHRMAVKSVDYDGKDLADKPIDVQGGQSITGVTVD